MSNLNRFRWGSSVVGLVFAILFTVGEILSNPVFQAVSIVVLFVDFLLISIKTRCPDCKRSLPLHPPILKEEEFCRYCGTKIE